MSKSGPPEPEDFDPKPQPSHAAHLQACLAPEAARLRDLERQEVCVPLPAMVTLAAMVLQSPARCTLQSTEAEHATVTRAEHCGPGACSGTACSM